MSTESSWQGRYEIMQLVRNDTADTLGEASSSTSISGEELKTDRKSNIFGGEVFLAKTQGERSIHLGDYFGSVAGREDEDFSRRSRETGRQPLDRADRTAVPGRGALMAEYLGSAYYHSGTNPVARLLLGWCSRYWSSV